MVCLDAASTITVLGEPAADVRYGASVAYLADLAAFARELAEPGRILPCCASDENGPVALWRPVIQGPDIAATNSPTAAMSPVTSTTALLDQLPDATVAVRGRPLAELLRPAYPGLGCGALGERRERSEGG